MIKLYLTRLKILSRDRTNIFWTFLFPIILASLFNLTLGNAYNEKSFDSIKIALIENKSYEYMMEFKDTLLEAKTTANGDSIHLFNVTEIQLKEAQSLLNNNKIIGYIQPGSTMNLIVKSSGIEQTIAKSFLENYAQSLNTLGNIGNPQLYPQIVKDISNPSNYIIPASMGENPPDVTLNHYYALLAMACLFGGFWGLKEIVYIQADLSWKGARVNITPIHKMEILLCNLLATLTIHFVGILMLLGFLIFGLKINFGNNFSYVLLTSLFASIFGISLGAMISTLTKKDENFKGSVVATIVMSSSFLAGLMMVEMKHIIATKLPFLQYVNPAGIITDAFYSLYYYENYDRFFINLILMVAYSLLFSFITYLAVRRKKYESL